MTETARRATQASRILAHLKAGRRLTQLDAEEEFGCRRLAARIGELRKEGFPVESRMVETSSGAKVAEYWLATPDFEQGGLFG